MAECLNDRNHAAPRPLCRGVSWLRYEGLGMSLRHLAPVETEDSD